MGLIARELEARGIATLCLSSARSITEAVRPPRAVFLDFPLGHTAGKPGDKPLQRRILRDALDALESIAKPGTLIDLPYRWQEDDHWKDTAMRPEHGASHQDDRVTRHAQPVYQSNEDAIAAERALAESGCPTCIWLPD